MESLLVALRKLELVHESEAAADLEELFDLWKLFKSVSGV